MKPQTFPTFNRNMLFIGISILLSACAQLLMKFGVLELHGSENILSIYWLAATWVSIGIACYGLSMLFWMAALTKYELSFAYPMLSLSYVLVYIAAALIPQLDESVSLWKTIGIAFIVIGVVLVTKTKKEMNTIRDKT